MTGRFLFFCGTIGLGYGLLIAHLYDLQMIRGNHYIAAAQAHSVSPGVGVAERGTIYFTDRFGNYLPVATIREAPFLYAVPAAIDDPAETARMLAPVIREPAGVLEKILSQRRKTFLFLARDVSSSTVATIQSLQLKGVYASSEPKRFYPFGRLAAHLLGFVGLTNKEGVEVGQYGLEKFYEASLRGQMATTTVGLKTLPAGGQDLYLTIDPNIQKEAERVLTDLVKSFEAPAGQIIIQEPPTGKILALTAWPDFDPNNYSNSSLENFLNPATQKLYEPGSIFKVITMSAGIDSGKITPETIYLDTGIVKLNGRTIKNWDFADHGGYGRITMARVIERSLNTGAVFAERATGNKIFTEYVKRFGLRDKTGVDLPNELTGDLRRLSPREPEVAFATASFGQGVAVTPLELITAVSTIANGGILMRPYLNAALTPLSIRRVIAGATAEAVTKMMVGAVAEWKIGQIKGYSFAGKSGTAFVPDFKHGGYTDQVINTYIGFGPTAKPRFIILVRLDKPRGAPLAGLSIVPAYRELAQFLLNYYDIPPDETEPKTAGL